MSSMLGPFNKNPKPGSQRQQPLFQPESNAIFKQEAIPTYAEASALPAAPPAPAPIPSPFAPPGEPPAYAVLDSNQTIFMIFGTFIHTPAGAAYQLSSPLDQRGPYFRLRRLRAKEVSQVGSTPISFDRSASLYEINKPPLLDNEYHLIGKRKTCLPGVVEMKFRMSRWHVKHVPTPHAKAREILTCKKVGAFFSAKLDRRKEMETSEWKDSKGRVLATEVLKVMEDGGVVPTVELSRDLDQTWRELLISLWATRLWVAFGCEKTNALGDRYANIRLAKFWGGAVVAGSGLLLGSAAVGAGTG